MTHKKQLLVFAGLLFVTALMPLLTYILIPIEQIAPGQAISPQFQNMPGWQLGLANAAIVFFIYGLLGLLGYFLARRLGLPGIYRAGASWNDLLVRPLWMGLLVGVVITGVDTLISLGSSWGGFTHPRFPSSLFGSVSAGIGEEILFRLFMLSLWAFLLNLVLRRWNGRQAALVIANVIAALVFAAGHLPTLMTLLGTTNPAQLPALALVDLVLLNGILGIIAGRAFIKDGLVAAAGIHFWADIAWHVILPLVLG